MLTTRPFTNAELADKLEDLRKRHCMHWVSIDAGIVAECITRIRGLSTSHLSRVADALMCLEARSVPKQQAAAYLVTNLPSGEPSLCFEDERGDYGSETHTPVFEPLYPGKLTGGEWARVYSAWELLKAERNREAYDVLSALVGWDAQKAEPLATTPPAVQSREAQMVVLDRDAKGTPTIWCDPEIADIVAALNTHGLRTSASCSGHGHVAGIVMLADGRELLIAKDTEQRNFMLSVFGTDINGTPSAAGAAQAVETCRVPVTVVAWQCRAPVAGFSFGYVDTPEECAMLERNGWTCRALSYTAVPASTPPAVAAPTAYARHAVIVQAAKDLLTACKKQNDEAKWPYKYAIPYGEVVALREALGFEAAEQSHEELAALEREHMGDPDKQTGIYSPSYRVGWWLSAALEDPMTCQEMKDDINDWFNSGSPAAPAQAVEVSDAMVDAYLNANDAYWKRTDEVPTPPDKWRTGTPREATRESLRAALQASKPEGSPT